MILALAILVAISGAFCVRSTSLASPSSDEVVAIVPVGDTPTYIALTPDGTRAYAVNSGSQGDPNKVGTVSVINTATNTAVKTISVGIGFPFQVAFTSDGTKAYVAISSFAGATLTAGTDRVAVIDTATNSVIATIAQPYNSGPIGVATTPDGDRVYVTRRFAGSVAVIDTASNSVVAEISVGGTPVGIAITPDGTRVYVGNRGTSQVKLIDTAMNKVIATISMPPGVGPSTSTTSIAFTPDGSQAYVTYSESNNIAVIDTATNTVVAVISTSAGGLREIAFTHDGFLAYVAHLGTNAVEVISTGTKTVVDTVPVGDSPYGVALLSNFSVPLRVYVTNSDSNNVSVIEPLYPVWIPERWPAAVDVSPHRFGVFVGIDGGPWEDQMPLDAYIKPPAWVGPADIDVTSLTVSVYGTTLADTVYWSSIGDHLTFVSFRLDLADLRTIVGVEVTGVRYHHDWAEVLTTRPTQLPDIIELTISGRLLDGRPFALTDTVRTTSGATVLEPKSRPSATWEAEERWLKGKALP